MTTQRPLPPENLILIRHGYSEANMVAKGIKFDGTPVGKVPAEFYSRHDSLMRLDASGEYQAAMTGEWLREWHQTSRNADANHFVSPHVRTRETAYHLALNAQWRIDDRLRERDWGRIANQPHEEVEKRHPGVFNLKAQNEWYWRPPSGESLATDVRGRFTSLLEDMQTPYAPTAIIVTHGELIRVAEFVLENMTPEEWLAHDANKTYTVHNCMALHYTRRDPNTGTLNNRYTHKRGIVPWDQELSWDNGEWQEIGNHLVSDEELITTVDNYPRLLT